jgi:hypothetical protein
MAFIAAVINYNKFSGIMLHCIRKHTTKLNQFLLAGLSAPRRK